MGAIAITLLWMNAYDPQGGLVNGALVGLGFTQFENYPWLSQDHLYWSVNTYGHLGRLWVQHDSLPRRDGKRGHRFIRLQRRLMVPAPGSSLFSLQYRRSGKRLLSLQSSWSSAG